MLPAANRMRRSADFRQVLRSGDRARLARVIVHQHRSVSAGAAPPIVGLVVGRSVGNSVVRHRVSRRLRAQLALRLDRLPDGSATVVRALPPAAAASSVDLGADLDRGLRRLAEQAELRRDDAGRIR